MAALSAAAAAAVRYPFFILSPLAYASPARCVSMLCIYLKVPSHLSQATILLRKRDGFHRLSYFLG